MLQIVIPGKPMSGNHAKTPQVIGRTASGKPRFRNVRTAEARLYDERVASIGKAAAAIARWKIPDYVRCDTWLCNVRTDGENANKEIRDPLQGIAFWFDSRILDGRTIKCKDKYGPRVVLQIRPVDGKLYGYRRPHA